MSPGRIDHGVVRRHLLALDEILAQLARHAGGSIEALRSDLDERWAVERGLQLCVQNVLDFATHLVASAGRDVADYTSAIDQMGQLGIISPALTHALRPLAGFRTALVHGYLGIDLAIVHGVLNQHLDHVRDFAAAATQYVVAQNT
jgi:uncharacterized protein YutE (UPF0331/DUF86 family)